MGYICGDIVHKNEVIGAAGGSERVKLQERLSAPHDSHNSGYREA